MLKTLTSLATLLAAASLVNLANSSMTTVMPLRMLEDGASGTMVALFGAVFFLGFALGCFTQPPLIQRIGYIRAFAAAAGLCTVLAVVMDLSDSIALWLALRFFMGVSIAAIFAAVDGWINGTATDAMRGKVFATYGWCMGASAVLSQMLLVRFDGMTVGFLTVLALSFNVGLVLVAMTGSVAPSTQAAGREGGRGLVFTSAISVAVAVYAGMVTTAILSTLPAILAGSGLDEAHIGAALSAFFLGRLLLQIPLGIIADRMDLRLLVAIIAGLTGAIAAAGAVLVMWDAVPFSPAAGQGGRIPFLAVMLVAGGLVLPLYTLANSLAFARANGRPAVRIATSLLLVNSVGAVVGPLLVALVIPLLGSRALAAVILAASALMTALAFMAWRRGASETTSTSLTAVPATSLASTVSVAEAKYSAPPEAEPGHPAPAAPRKDIGVPD